MGQVNCRKHYLSLRKSLVLYVIAFVVLAVFLSVTTFSICDGAAEGISASYPPSGEKYYLTNEQGEQLGNGAYIGTVPVPMSKEDECTIALCRFHLCRRIRRCDGRLPRKYRRWK